jgi:hypothetical protein
MTPAQQADAVAAERTRCALVAEQAAIQAQGEPRAIGDRVSASQ